MLNHRHIKQAAEDDIHRVIPLSYSFLLWTVERTCGVQNCLLGIVEQLGDVL